MALSSCEMRKASRYSQTNLNVSYGHDMARPRLHQSNGSRSATRCTAWSIALSVWSFRISTRTKAKRFDHICAFKAVSCIASFFSGLSQTPGKSNYNIKMLHPQTRGTCHLPLEIGRVFEIERVLSNKAHRAVYVAKKISTRDKIVVKRLTPDNDLARWRSALREVKFLRYLNHDNIISIRDIRISFDCDSLTDIYLVEELMATDLQHIIATHSISGDDCRLLIGQLLCAVEAMHSAGILHRDIKPSNILLDTSCHLKVGDLSLARSSTQFSSLATIS